jgi:hypothetical protein
MSSRASSTDRLFFGGQFPNPREDPQPTVFRLSIVRAVTTLPLSLGA